MPKERAQPEYHRISGRAILLETGIPREDVEVRAFVLSRDARSDIEQAKPLELKDAEWVGRNNSLGSSLTDGNGRFYLEFSPDRLQANAQFVIVASVSTASRPNNIVFISPYPIPISASNEETLVGISYAQIYGTDSDEGEDVIAASMVNQAHRANRNQRVFRKAVSANIEERSQAARKNLAEVNKALRDRARAKFVDANGNVLENYVDEGKSVTQVKVKTLSNSLLSIVRARLQAQIDLDQDARKILTKANGELKASVTSDTIRKVLYDDRHNPELSNWSFYDGLALDCRRRDIVSKFDLDTSLDENEEEEPDTDAEVEPATTDDVKRHLAKLLQEIEQASVNAEDHEKRGSLPGINGFVHGLDLTGGAADEPAVFDFESLQIAFDHVWADIFDPIWPSILATDLAVTQGTNQISADAAPAPAPAPAPGGATRATVRNDVIDRLRADTNELHVIANTDQDFMGHGDTVPYGFGLGGIIKSVANGVIDLLEDTIDVIIPGGGEKRPPREPDDKPARRPRKPRRRGERTRILNRYLKNLERLIAKPYEFTPFGVDENDRAINYGQVVTYKQVWTPQNYQAGELTKTIPLAPGQKMKFSTKRIQKTTYREKKSEASENTYNRDTQTTARDVSKIVRSAQLETSLTMENKVDASVPGVGGGSDTKTTFQTKFSMQSSKTKDVFREQVRKEASSFKNSTAVEIEFSEETETIDENSGEITNPNDEIAFTALFYELQRRFSVDEKLKRVTPVILVAENIWKPSDISPQRLSKYDWILRRVLLDPSFEDALDSISRGEFVAQEAGLADLEQAMDEQFDVVEDLRVQLTALLESQAAEDDGRRTTYRRSKSQNGDEGPFNAEQARLDELKEGLRRQEGLLNQAVQAFNEAFEEYATNAIQVARFRLHVKDNIVYYMQAIWDHEDNHQAFMRLRNTKVPVINGNVVYSLSKTDLPEEPPFWRAPYELLTRPNDFEVTDEFVDLTEVADLSRPLGFFGNYRIFPLTKLNPVSEFLLTPFLSGHAGVRDPDSTGNYNSDDLVEYLECLRRNLSNDDFDDLKPKLREVLERRLDNAKPNAEEIVIPTSSLFIELLPGHHSAIEYIKRQHRAIDVGDALTDVITKRIDQLRHAARITSDKLSDPSVEKVVVVDPENADLGDI